MIIESTGSQRLVAGGQQPTPTHDIGEGSAALQLPEHSNEDAAAAPQPSPNVNDEVA